MISSSIPIRRSIRKMIIPSFRMNTDKSSAKTQGAVHARSDNRNRIPQKWEECSVIRDTICGAEPGPMMAHAVEAGMHEC